MKIANATLQMASTHLASQQYERTESLRLWVGDERRTREEALSSRPARASTDNVQISEAGKSAQSSEAEATGKNRAPASGDPRLSLIKTLLEFLTGRQIKVFDASQLEAATRADASPDTERLARPTDAGSQQSAGYGLEYDQYERYSESEKTTFSASGTIRTADGRDVSFAIDLTMARSFTFESNASLRLGDAVRKTDPLVLNFAGTAAQLTDTRFAFDLDSDGKAEQINFVAAGSGFLVLDRNRDGQVSNGKELFGPSSGNGFGELSELDADRNGWIDENDPAFQDLRIWTKDTAGNNHLESLAEVGVGALALTWVNTPFEIRDYAGAISGQIRNSGVFLQEGGEAGTIQQVDLTI